MFFRIILQSYILLFYYNLLNQILLGCRANNHREIHKHILFKLKKIEERIRELQNDLLMQKKLFLFLKKYWRVGKRLKYIIQLFKQIQILSWRKRRQKLYHLEIAKYMNQNCQKKDINIIFN